MAKFLGTQAGFPVQAAAGATKRPLPTTWEQRVQTPTGFLFVAGLLAAGGIVGSAVGHSIKEGVPLLAVDPGRAPTDFEEWISAVGAYGALVMSGDMVRNLAQQYGWARVGGYSAAYLAAVWAIKTVKDR